MENKKMMENMTKIMMAPKTTYKYTKPPSLNENERKMKVDLVNLDNRLLHDRLTKVSPVIDRKEFEESFRRHVLVREHMQRKFIKPEGHSKGKKGDKGGSVNVNSMFDSATYGANQSDVIQGMGGDSLSMGSALGGSPIKSMTEFRKHVIAKKAAENRVHAPVETYTKKTGALTGGGTISFDNLPARETSVSFEMSHNPA